MAYCECCKNMVFNIPVRKAVLDKSSTINCLTDIAWDGCLLNEIKIEKEGDLDILVHTRCSTKLKLFRLN